MVMQAKRLDVRGPSTVLGLVRSRELRLPTVCVNFKVAQPLFGLTLMADFAQGLDASKLILAETVRFFQLL
jgi:hypothetical protein